MIRSAEALKVYLEFLSRFSDSNVFVGTMVKLSDGEMAIAPDSLFSIQGYKQDVPQVFYFSGSDIEDHRLLDEQSGYGVFAAKRKNLEVLKDSERVAGSRGVSGNLAVPGPFNGCQLSHGDKGECVIGQFNEPVWVVSKVSSECSTFGPRVR